jgi:hypothetical protein
MATKKQKAAPRKAVGGVDAYMAGLQHPHKTGVQALRELILGLDERIHEEVKWNAPSFRLDDHFATFRLHPAPAFQLVLHDGTKAKKPPRQFRLDDPEGLVKWAAKDRCVLTFASAADAAAKREAVRALVLAWMAQL